MNRSMTFCVLLSSLLTISACQQGRQLSEMHDSTDNVDKTSTRMDGKLESMNTTMGGMAKNTVDLVDKTGHLSQVTETNLSETNARMKTLAETTDGICLAGRHAQAAINRDNAFKRILAANTPEAKTAAATSFLMSFEFQQWGICGSDTLEVREQLINTGIQEFFYTIVDTVSPNTTALAMASRHSDLDQAALRDDNFNAIAASLHGIDDVQLQVLKRASSGNASKLPSVSMLSLLEEGLKLSQSSSETVKPWQHQVLSHRTLALRLIQSRQSFAIAAVVGKLIPEPTSSNIGTSASLLVDRIVGGFHIARKVADWEANINDFTVDELNDLSFYLTIAVESRKFLKNIGLTPIIDPEFAPIFNGLTLSSTGSVPKEMFEARSRFSRLMKLVKAN